MGYYERDPMRIALMQPYFFPYLGHFDLLNMVDEWIVFDTAQYMRSHWMNRNRILHPAGGWEYITVPVRKHPTNTPGHQVEIAMAIDWRNRILRKLQHYRNKAPYYQDVMDFVEECFADVGPNLSETNIRILEKTRTRLGIKTPMRVLSRMDLRLEPVLGPGDWGFEISRLLGAREYVNPAGGAALFDRDQFEKHGIKLTIQNFSNIAYDCRPYRFEPGLSIIDVMMWNRPEQIKNYLDTWREGDAAVSWSGERYCDVV
jgi:hypothetical protein